MMVKSAQPREGGGARPPFFTLSTITSKVVVYATAERADTLPLFLLYPYMYSLVQDMDIVFFRGLFYFYHAVISV
jgi:hypothetical protein